MKVSRENGEVKAGDYLTSSSLPGVAMKATKAGLIIGQALEDYSQVNDVGLVMAFVKTQYFTGAKVYSADGSEKLVGTKLLQAMTAPTAIVTPEIDLSEINTDRVVAGLEMITPKVITKDILATGMFVMQDKEGNENVKITSDGNAIFMGTIKADKIEANEIKGFKLLTDSISTLSDKVAGMATVSAEPTGVTTDEKPVSVQVADLISGMFRQMVEFFGKVIFHSDVYFAGRPTFNKDTAGFAIVKSGGNEVEVSFEKEYKEEPVVTLGLQIVGAVDLSSLPAYAVADVDTKGFKIRLSRNTSMDIRFAWMAIAVDGGRTIEGNGTVIMPQNPTPTAEPTPPAEPTVEMTPAPSAEPTPTPTPEPTPVTEVSPLPTPTVEPTVEMTPAPNAEPTPTP